MTMTERVLHDVVVLEINGRMTIEAQQSELSGLVKQRIAAGYHAFLFNLGGVPYCDTRGLAELIVSLTIVEGAQGTLKLVNVPPHVYKLLDTAGLAVSFQIFDSIETGLRSFESGKAPPVFLDTD